MPSVHGVNDDGAGFGVKGENTTPPDLGHLHEAGVVGTSKTGVGVFGTAGDITSFGLFGNAGTGVQGVSPDGPGVSGLSSTGPGVLAESKTGIGVHGVGGQLAARFDGNVRVNGPISAENTTNVTIGNHEPGVMGTSKTGVGVFGIAGDITSFGLFGNAGTGVQGVSPDGPGVSGLSAKGPGVLGESKTGIGVHGLGGQLAGKFDGVVQVNGTGDIDAIDATTSSANHAAVAGHNTGGGFGVWATGKTAGHFESSDGRGIEGISTADGGAGVYGKGTTFAGQFDGMVIIAGQLSVVGGDVNVLTGDVILRGADCAEDFDIAAGTEIGPGTVMVLTDDGALQPSQDAYDKKVAGVISGAGDYRPGLILARRDSSQGRMPLALVGKVYCKVDAKYGPIEVGDLLTTSATSGHAMRAADPFRAFGAVLGKALRRLDAGQGLIPILVSLQ